MYEIQLVSQCPEAYLPLLGIKTIPDHAALYVMREQGLEQCAALVSLEEKGCTLLALGKTADAPDENVGVLLEWIFFKYGQSFAQLGARLPEGSDALLTAYGFIEGADGTWSRPLSTGCRCCSQSE